MEFFWTKTTNIPTKILQVFHLRKMRLPIKLVYYYYKIIEIKNINIWLLESAKLKDYQEFF